MKPEDWATVKKVEENYQRSPRKELLVDPRDQKKKLLAVLKGH